MHDHHLLRRLTLGIRCPACKTGPDLWKRGSSGGVRVGQGAPSVSKNRWDASSESIPDQRICPDSALIACFLHPMQCIGRFRGGRFSRTGAQLRRCAFPSPGGPGVHPNARRLAQPAVESEPIVWHHRGPGTAGDAVPGVHERVSMAVDSSPRGRVLRGSAQLEARRAVHHPELPGSS
jgi:hypothetical protein